jgi:hypothetical protein
MDAMNSAAPAGTRLRCASCGTEIVVVKPATGPLTCCSQPLTDLTATPASTAGPDDKASDDAEPTR